MATMNIPAEKFEAYLEEIKADYVKFWKPEDLEKEHIQEMIEEFNKGLRYKVGSKYIKVMTSNSVHSFIVNNEKAKFPLGTVLKAASWAAPATNFGRGSILDGSYQLRWTGAF
jgi:uncharacterized protein YueI